VKEKLFSLTFDNFYKKLVKGMIALKKDLSENNNHDYHNSIFLKQEAGKKLGYEYEYEIWIYDGKGNKVECYK
jgi:hypothetical protein